MKIIGARIKQLREKAGISQDQLASILGVTKQAISHYENGTRNPKGDFANKIIEYFGISADYLAGFSDGDAFENYLDSLGCELYRDDPEHRPFISFEGTEIQANYDTLPNIKASVDDYVLALLRLEIRKLQEIEIAKLKEQEAIKLEKLRRKIEEG